MNYQYLKAEQYFQDLYDLHTIKECLKDEQFWKDAYRKKDDEERFKDLPKEEIDRGFNYFFTWHMRIVKGERYRYRNESIARWMDDAHKRQEKIDVTTAPADVHCTHCHSHILVEKSKHLEDIDTSKPLRVLFLLECTVCKKREWIYDNGDVRISTPELCPNCSQEIKTKCTFKHRVLTTTTTCPHCSYHNVDVDDWDKKDAQREAEKKADEELLEKYRSTYCLSDKEGQEYIELIDSLEVAGAVHAEAVAEYDNPVYEHSLQIQKMGITSLEKVITTAIETSNFTKLSLSEPEIGRYVIVPFTVQDNNTSRTAQASCADLEKILIQVLEKTNWRLVSKTVGYRLGYLEGSLKGYESEQDILDLAGKQQVKKPKSKIDPEKRQKYAHHNVVQLARLLGEHEGIEKVRMRRLATEPDGFFLKASEGPLTCRICKENHPGNEIWWKPDGLRCVDCWRNIQEGVIPMFDFKKKSEDREFIHGWQLKSELGIHPSSVKKLRREGKLVGRDLKRTDGSIYETIYLVGENRNFFEEISTKS